MFRVQQQPYFCVAHGMELIPNESSFPCRTQAAYLYNARKQSGKSKSILTCLFELGGGSSKFNNSPEAMCLNR